jgi:Ca-activated chloride channel family protein
MTLRANVRLEHELLALDHDGHVDLMLEIEAPRPASAARRPPARAALVVDESGSMHGPKLLTAKRCLAWLAGRLDRDDRVALVGFDTEARLHRPLGPAGGEDLLRAVAGLAPRGTTNLSAGLLMGLEQLEGAPDGPRALILLTDGWANEGVTDPDRLVALARGAAARGTTVSTIGFGEEFSEDLLQAMAAGGGGRAHYAPTPDAAPAIFAEELRGLTALVAQTVSLEVRPHPLVTRVDALNDLPATPVAGGVRLDLGEAFAGDRRRVVLRLEAGHLRTLGPCAIAELVLRHVAVSDGAERHTVRIPVAVNLVSAEEARRGGSDLAVTTEVESLLADRARDEAIRRADAGDNAAAQDLLRQTSERLSRRAGHGPDGRRLADKAGQLAEEERLFAEEAYGSTSRKIARYRSWQSRRDRGDSSPEGDAHGDPR